MPPAGMLNQRITVQGVVRISDGGGGYEETWANIVTCWAQVQPLAGLERLTAAQQESTTDYRVTIRWREGLTAEMRVLWRGYRLDVNAIADAGPQAGFIALDCRSMGAA